MSQRCLLILCALLPVAICGCGKDEETYIRLEPSPKSTGQPVDYPPDFESCRYFYVVPTPAEQFDTRKKEEFATFMLAALPANLNAFDRDDRVELCRHLADLGEDALPLLLQMAKDPDAKIRRAAVGAMGSIGLKALPQLISALGDKDPIVQVAATDAISLMEKKGEPALPALKELAKNNKTIAAQAARAAIKSITEADEVNFSPIFRIKRIPFGLKPLPAKKRGFIEKQVLETLKARAQVYSEYQGYKRDTPGDYVVDQVYPIKIRDLKAYLVMVTDKRASHAEGYHFAGVIVAGSGRSAPARWLFVQRSEYLELIGLVDVEGDGIDEIVFLGGWQHFGVFTGMDRVYRYEGDNYESIFGEDIQIDNRCGSSTQEASYFNRLGFHDVNGDGIQELVVSGFETVSVPKDPADEDGGCREIRRYVGHGILKQVRQDNRMTWIISHINQSGRH